MREKGFSAFLIGGVVICIANVFGETYERFLSWSGTVLMVVGVVMLAASWFGPGKKQ
jgi:uncharacterized membrane protein YhhN